MSNNSEQIISHWKWVRVGEILQTASGGTPKTGVKDYWENGNIPWLNSGGLNDGVINEPTSYITKLGLQNSSAKLFPKETVLVALTGATIGRIGILNIDCSTNQSVTGIYPSRYIIPRYIYYYFLSIRAKLISQAIGSAQPHINKGVIDNTIIPLAPMSHQKEVVRLLDKLSTISERLHFKFQKLKDLENSAYESYIFNQGDLYESLEIGSFCSERKERVGDSAENIKLIGVSRELGVEKLRVTVAGSYSKYKKVYPGDFLYNPMRINIGSVAIYEGDMPAATSPDYIVFKVDNRFSPLVLLKYLKSDLGISQINNNTRGSVRSRLYYSSLAKITVPFCGEKEHREAQKVMEKFRDIIGQSNSLLENLPNVLNLNYQTVFSGEPFLNVPIDINVDVLKEKLNNELANLKIKKKVKNSKNSVKRTRKSVNVLEVIRDEFGDNPFSFKSLAEKTNLSYDQLKDQIFDMLDKEIVLDFNKQEGRMYLKKN